MSLSPSGGGTLALEGCTYDPPKLSPPNFLSRPGDAPHPRHPLATPTSVIPMCCIGTVTTSGFYPTYIGIMTVFGQFRPNSGAAVVQRVDEEDEGHECHVDHAQIPLLYSVFVKHTHTHT